MKRLSPLVPLLILGVSACGDVPTEPVSLEASPEAASAEVTPLSLAPEFTTEPQDLLGHHNGDHAILRIDTADATVTGRGPTGFNTTWSAMNTSRGPVTVAGNRTYPAGTHFGVMRTGNKYNEWVFVVDTDGGPATPIVQIQGLLGPRGAAFGPDGTTLYIITNNGRLQTVDLVTGALTHVRWGVPRSNALDWDPDAGAFVATYNGRLWHVSPSPTGSNTELSRIFMTPCTIARAPDGRWFTVSGQRLWEVDLYADGRTEVGYDSQLSSAVCGTAFAPRRAVQDGVTAGAGGPYQGVTGEPVQFEGTGSDLSGGDVTLFWDFGDISPPGIGPTPTHTYAQPGVYDVTLTVVAENGNSATASTTATIEEGSTPNAPPIVLLGGDKTISHQHTEGYTQSDPFLLEAAFDDLDSQGPWSWTVYWGHGDPTTGTSTAVGPISVSHYFPPTTDEWTVRLEVTDEGGASGEAAITVTTTNAEPAAVAQHNPDCPVSEPYYEGMDVCLNAGPTRDPDDDVRELWFEWDLDLPLEQITGETGGLHLLGPNQVYADDGLYTVTVTVTDHLGLSHTSDDLTFEIFNLPPVVDFGEHDVVELGNPLNLQAGFTDPGVLDAPWTWSIDWGDGISDTGTTHEQGTGTLQNQHTYTAWGTYEVEVCVEDKDGGVGCETTTVTIQDTTPPDVYFEGNQPSYSVMDDVAIYCHAFDLSPLVENTCRDFVGPAWTFYLEDLPYTATATDNAGNTGSAMLDFEVLVDYDGLCALVRELVSHHGIANSLCVKLRASARAKRIGSHNGPLGAFISEVEAQSGKKIEPGDAEILIAMARSLMW